MTGALLRAGDYCTQRNNQVRPAAACMPTARVMWYKANDINFWWEISLFAQPEDYFMHLLDSDEAKAFCLEKYPWSVGIPPCEVHGMYGSWLDQKVTGERRSDFLASLSWDGWLRYIDERHAIMSAAMFPKTEGHAFVAIGRRDDRCTLRIADPWGDWRTQYADTCGYDVALPRQDWERMVRGDGAGKWAHVPWSA